MTLTLRKSSALLITSLLLFTGCVQSRSANVYTSDQAMQAQTVDYGTAMAVREVTIEGNNPPAVGTAIGGVAGGVIGSTIGSGRGKKLATVGGALAGAAAGAATEKQMGTRAGLEIEVKMDSGRTLVIVQESDLNIKPGDRVRVLTSRDGTTRVST